MPIPLSVTHTELMAAIKPLCELLGTSPRNFFAETGLHIDSDAIRFTVPIYHDGEHDKPKKRAGYGYESRAIGVLADGPTPPAFTHPQGLEDSTPVAIGGDDATAEWGLEITVHLVAPWLQSEASA